MLTWKLPLLALLLVAAGALYIRQRWHRAPQAYRAMIALAACYSVAGVLIGVWALHLALPKNSPPAGNPTSAHSTIPETAVANPSSADGLAIAKYLTQTHEVHAFDMCDVIGMYADSVAVYREIGLKPDALSRTLHTEIEKKAADSFLATSDMSPLEGVIDKEIDYAYGNHELGATQVRSYWVNSCLAERRD